MIPVILTKWGIVELGIVNECDSRDLRRSFFEQFHPLADDRNVEIGDPCGIALRMSNIFYDAGYDWIPDSNEDNWDCAGPLLYLPRRKGAPSRDNHVGTEAY